MGPLRSYAPLFSGSFRIERAAYAAGAVAQDMGVDHGRRDVAMAEQFLYGSNVLDALEQVGGEGMAESVARHALVDSGRLGSVTDGALHDRFVQMVPSFSSFTVPPASRGREDPLPPMVTRSRGDPSHNRLRQPDLARSTRQILLVHEPRMDDLLVQLRCRRWSARPTTWS